LPIKNFEIPGFYCSDDEVQQFIEREIWNFNPYSYHKSARELFDAARLRFSDYRCWDLEIQPH
jgi:hypothetical protein